MLRIFFYTASALLAVAANAATVSPYDVVTAEIHQIPNEQLKAADSSAQPDCGKMSPSDLGSIGWGTILNIGQQVWKIVEAGKPVVNVTNPPEAFALPQGLSCWQDLDSWQVPQAQSYEVDYKNLMGMEVAKFRFRLQYNYGGGKKGLGRYLANVTVLPADLSVMWGYTFNASVETEQPLNVGTDSNPVASLGLNVKWDVSTVLKDNQSSYHFVVQGDGKVQTDQ